MAKATEKTESAFEVPATEVAAGNVRRTAKRTFLDSATGKTVEAGDLFETTEQRAKELVLMGCIEKA